MMYGFVGLFDINCSFPIIPFLVWYKAIGIYSEIIWESETIEAPFQSEQAYLVPLSRNFFCGVQFAFMEKTGTKRTKFYVGLKYIRA